MKKNDIAVQLARLTKIVEKMTPPIPAISAILPIPAILAIDSTKSIDDTAVIAKTLASKVEDTAAQVAGKTKDTAYVLATKVQDAAEQNQIEHKQLWDKLNENASIMSSGAENDKRLIAVIFGDENYVGIKKLVEDTNAVIVPAKNTFSVIIWILGVITTIGVAWGVITGFLNKKL